MKKKKERKNIWGLETRLRLEPPTRRLSVPVDGGRVLTRRW